jgi:hypothetical protein
MAILEIDRVKKAKQAEGKKVCIKRLKVVLRKSLMDMHCHYKII